MPALADKKERGQCTFSRVEIEPDHRSDSSGWPLLRGAMVTAAILLVLGTEAARPARAQVESLPNSFTGQESTNLVKRDGAKPELGSLVMDSSGNLFGTTAAGGSMNNSLCEDGCGTVFELTAASGYSTEIVLHYFAGHNSTTPAASDGAEPEPGSLVMDSSGNLFGTTAAGGSFNRGTVFELTAASGYNTEIVIHSFTGSDGTGPEAALTMDSSGNLFGTTYGDGSSGDRTVFELARPAPGSSTWTRTVPHSLAGSNQRRGASRPGPFR